MSLSQLQRLLPLPEEDLQQILDYGSSLSKDEAAAHFNGILGESPGSIEFISSFNSRRKDPVSLAAQDTMSSSQGVPRTSRPPKKKKAPLHSLPARQVTAEYADQGRAYRKDDDNDYIPQKSKSTNTAASNSSGLSTQPSAAQSTNGTTARPSSGTSTPRAPPSAAGSLISDIKSKSQPGSRTSSPAPNKALKTKVSIVGGTPMHGASTALSALDFAIRSLELSTNPTKQDNASRACNCIATRHELLAAAPNCLNCGKVICVKEGLGPCTFCGHALLSSDQIQGMIKSLKEERGRERMALDAQTHRKAEVSKVPAPFSNPRSGGPTPGEHGMTAAEIKAKEHRDRLLGFQSQNAKRTTVHDEAADFETPETGTNMWGSMEERAKQLKRQQKILAEQEWSAKPEWEKRREVVSIDVVGGKVVRRMGKVERPSELDVPVVNEPVSVLLTATSSNGNKGAGTFSQNPLLGKLIKPVYHIGTDVAAGEEQKLRKKTWRRVQDDYDDDSAERLILDGGALGGIDTSLRRPGEEEHSLSH